MVKKAIKKSKETIKLNLGCAGRLLEGYINIDIDTMEQIIARYPNQKIQKGMEVFNFDILNLPFPEASVSEIKADSLIEHLSFIEESKFFYEIKRVLKSGGIFEFSTPDFEDAVKLWLNAKDDWKEFFRDDPEAIASAHWFGQYSYSTENRWSYLLAMIFGSQNGEGQFHKNCFTIGKIRAILKYIDFEEIEISNYRWKDDRDLMIYVRAKKK